MAESSSKTVQVGPIRLSWDAERDLMICSFVKGARVDIDDAHACTKAIVELNGGRSTPMLVDFTGLESQTKESRDYFANDPAHTRVYTAVAIVVTSALARIIANFYMGINKPEKPTRLFDDRQQALDWLAQVG